MKAALLCAVAVVGLSLDGCDPASPLIAACEAALKERLVAPATYRRIRVTKAPDELVPAEEYFEKSGDSPAVVAALRASGQQPMRRRAIIEYDAENRIGVPLRGIVECSYDALGKEELDRVTASSVRVNGKTITDYMIDAIKLSTP